MRDSDLMESLFQQRDKQTHQIITDGAKCCAGYKQDSVTEINWAGKILDDMIIQAQMRGSYELKSETREEGGHGKSQGNSLPNKRTETAKVWNRERSRSSLNTISR